jgi:hypothetical protein
VKSKRYAIANVEVGREGYLRIKQIVLGDIAKKLERNKELEFGVFNIGCHRRSN